MQRRYPRGFYLKCVLASLLVATVAACTAEDVEWIDVPLAENVFFDAPAEYRTEIVEIPVLANADLEYMLDMKTGYAVSYSWEAKDLNDPEKLLAEFHGHTVRTSDAPGDVMFYKQGRAESSAGYLVAPFDGVHGWYLSNETSEDILVTLSLSGFYVPVN